jgi:glutathione S-transferase
MATLELTVLSLRYSSWSIRPWLALTHAGAPFTTRTVELGNFRDVGLSERRRLGSVSGLFPVLRVDGVPIHESLAIAEYAAEAFPDAALWPAPILERARARAVCAEMVGNFSRLRSEMTCHVFGRVAGFRPSPGALTEIERVFEIWRGCLDGSGGPFLFGAPTITDFFYFPVLTRFRTYGIEVPDDLSAYARSIESLPAVARLLEIARRDPAIPIYDDFIRSIGGDPNAAL